MEKEMIQVSSPTSGASSAEAEASVLRQALKFHFARNSVYEYSYTTDTAIFFLNTPDAASRLTITGTAHIYVSTPCDFVLKLYDVVTLESDPVDQGHMRKSNRSRDFGVDLEREPLRFSFQDGRIHDICPVENENTWALNIKRGFLSAFQNSMKNLSFDENVEEPKSISPWTSIQECKQTIDSVGRLYSITCRGEHHFRPMRGDLHGAATVTSQEILFLRQSTRLETHPPFSKRLSLQYDSVEQDRQDKNSVMEKIGQILQNLCEHSKNGFRQDTPHVFWDLVACMRRLDAPLLKSLYETASSSSRCSDKTYIK
ncbi:hypothetical protein C0Q70_02410 [Pomacea canaliculata]|uniref:Vitellogenin domain-containing protein n=1 Tax=Pomacea canaliculata TaxID=400727 RepID=A0A2T7PPV5_POMCA|nr:hypothetical protein C0Q70_02410 [Pomacea canaliculata]